jgi:hypothetical protein
MREQPPEHYYYLRCQAPLAGARRAGCWGCGHRRPLLPRHIQKTKANIYAREVGEIALLSGDSSPPPLLAQRADKIKQAANSPAQSTQGLEAATTPLPKPARNKGRSTWRQQNAEERGCSKQSGKQPAVRTSVCGDRARQASDGIIAEPHGGRQGTACQRRLHEGVGNKDIFP